MCQKTRSSGESESQSRLGLTCGRDVPLGEVNVSRTFQLAGAAAVNFLRKVLRACSRMAARNAGALHCVHLESLGEIMHPLVLQSGCVREPGAVDQVVRMFATCLAIGLSI